MAKDTSIVFDEAASRHGRVPRFVLDFTRLGEQFISWHDGARWDLIEKVPSWTGNVKPDEGSADVSGVTVTVIDDQRWHQFMPLIARDEPVRLLGGFEGLLESDFAVLITGLVEDVTEAPPGKWSIKINDLHYYAVKRAFRNFGLTHLDGAVAIGDVNITVDSTDGTVTGDTAFHDPASLADTVTMGFIVDDEIIVPTAMAAAQFQNCARGQYQICGGSAAAAHDDNATVRELLIIEDNVIDIYLKILLSTGTGTNGAYDVWDADMGLGVDADLIDIDTFERERDRFIPTDTYRFALKAPISDVKSWSEKQLFKTMNAYPVITNAGQISLVLFHMPFASEPDELTDDDILDIVSWDRGLRDLVNNTHFLYDKSIIDGEYKLQRFDLESESINEHGLSPTWKADCDGLYSDLQADAIVSRRVHRLFERYANGPVSFKARVDFSNFRWDPGDILSVTVSTLMDIARGVRGVAYDFMELISWRPDPNTGEIDVEILDARLEGKAGMICPNGWPTWADADPEERNWAYICVTDTLLMPDGEPPTQIV